MVMFPITVHDSSVDAVRIAMILLSLRFISLPPATVLRSIYRPALLFPLLKHRAVVRAIFF